MAPLPVDAEGNIIIPEKTAWEYDVLIDPVYHMLVSAIVAILLTIIVDFILARPQLLQYFVPARASVADPEYTEDDDVIAERAAVKKAIENDARNTISVEGLRKVYPGGWNVKPKVAVGDVYFQVPEGQCFGYLGVNGAGKTTTLRMLTGDEVPSSGTASLGGNDILTQQNAVRRQIGYCPQFDALIDNLTGREHLFLYGRIKGYTGAKLESYVDNLVEKLGLQEYQKRPAKNYSGGNKRKLSVGIALIGNPTIVFLDEPTSGVDPSSRRFMWNLISTTMAGRSVILTTHSMDECEALCDKISIMASGRLQCIGPASHLKSKYGTGYQLEVSAPYERVEDVASFVTTTWPGATVTEIQGNHSTYRVPRDMPLPDVFRAMEKSKAPLQIENYVVSETTLEAIFLQMSAKANGEDDIKEKLKNAASFKAVIHDASTTMPSNIVGSPKHGDSFHPSPLPPLHQDATMNKKVHDPFIQHDEPQHNTDAVVRREPSEAESETLRLPLGSKSKSQRQTILPLVMNELFTDDEGDK